MRSPLRPAMCLGLVAIAALAASGCALTARTVYAFDVSVVQEGTPARVLWVEYDAHESWCMTRRSSYGATSSMVRALTKGRSNDSASQLVAGRCDPATLMRGGTGAAIELHDQKIPLLMMGTYLDPWTCDASVSTYWYCDRATLTPKTRRE